MTLCHSNSGFRVGAGNSICNCKIDRRGSFWPVLLLVFLFARREDSYSVLYMMQTVFIRSHRVNMKFAQRRYSIMLLSM